MTQLECAKKNTLTPLMKKVARQEGINPQALLKLIKELKKYGKEYDENIPMYEKYIKEGGDKHNPLSTNCA